MSDLFERFTRASTQAENNWQRNFVLPYGSAYNTALTSYRKTWCVRASCPRIWTI
jgi:hypothetical protein